MDTCDLTSKHCLPCEGGVPPLTPDQIREYQTQLTYPWQVIDNQKIEREYSFKNFKAALAFVNKVGVIAEAEGHHPDILLHDYKQVTITLWTHSIGGLSENDFILAAKISTIPGKGS